MRALYYTALAEEQEYSSIRPLIDWLDYNGFTMVTKPTKEFTDATGRRKVKGNMDIELAVDAMRLADTLDHIVIFSGDGDFRSLVAALQQKGKRVSVISTLQTQPPMVADELRRQADQFIDIADLEIARSAATMAAQQRARGHNARPGRSNLGPRLSSAAIRSAITMTTWPAKRPSPKFEVQSYQVEPLFEGQSSRERRANGWCWKDRCAASGLRRHPSAFYARASLPIDMKTQRRNRIGSMARFPHSAGQMRGC